MISQDDLMAIIQQFEDEVWFGSPALQDKVLYPRIEALSCFVFPVEILTLWQDSRINIVLKTGHRFVTIALDPILPNFCIVRKTMTDEEIFKNISFVIIRKNEFLTKLKPDPEVIAWFGQNHR